MHCALSNLASESSVHDLGDTRALSRGELWVVEKTLFFDACRFSKSGLVLKPWTLIVNQL